MPSRLFFLVLAGLVAATAQAGRWPTSLVSAAHAAQAAEARGTVQSVDTKAGRVKIAHEPVKSLGWPAMTMDFESADKTMLGQLKPGQQVLFTFEQRDKRFVITSIKPQG